jgi:hypothetical protein
MLMYRTLALSSLSERPKGNIPPCPSTYLLNFGSQNSVSRPQNAFLDVLKEGNDVVQSAHNDLLKIQAYFRVAVKYGVSELKNRAASVWVILIRSLSFVEQI